MRRKVVGGAGFRDRRLEWDYKVLKSELKYGMTVYRPGRSCHGNYPALTPLRRLMRITAKEFVTVGF
jgi:hypothetical protein